MPVSKFAAIDDSGAKPSSGPLHGAPLAARPVTTRLAAAPPPSRPPQVPATVADVMRAPATTVADTDHVAAAAYLMKHAGTAALLVLDAQNPGRAAGIVTEADVSEVVADGRDVNDVRIHELMTGRPAAIPAATRRPRRGEGPCWPEGLRELPVARDRTGPADVGRRQSTSPTCAARCSASAAVMIRPLPPRSAGPARCRPDRQRARRHRGGDHDGADGLA